MTQILPGGIDTGIDIQRLKLAAAPTAPYVLTAVVALPPESFAQRLAVRKTGDPTPTDWFYTETELVARIEGINYYEIKAYIDSGVATTFKLDRVDTPQDALLQYDAVTHDTIRIPRVGMLVNNSAWEVLVAGGGGELALEFVGPQGEIDRVPLTGGFGFVSTDPLEFSTPDRMWSMGVLDNTGWYRRGRILQTLFKHVPVRIGGRMGYLHIFGTIMAGTEEVQFEINWHNGGIEARTGIGPVAQEAGDEEIDPEFVSPPAGFGHSLAEGFLFHSVRIVGLSSLQLAPGHTAWAWTPQLMDSGNSSDSMMRVAQNQIVKPISDTDPNRVHCMPVTFERPFRFAVHPGDVTPYAKHAYAMADWSMPLGGWMFTPLGLPDWTALSADIAGMALSSENTAAKEALRTLVPWKGDELGTQQGIAPGDPFWPASWDSYGGSTSGTGMTPFVGAKQAWTAQGLDILFVHQIRDRARTYGCLYYNISGLPVIPQLHTQNMVANWDRFDRRFLKSGTTIHDSPFLIAPRTPTRIHLSDYNPGTVGNFTPQDAPGEATSRPDWYVPGEGNAAVALDTLSVGHQLTLANFSQTLGYTPPPNNLNPLPGETGPDLAVPVLIQLTGAGTYSSSKSITYRIVGIGEFDIEVTEDVVFLGNGAAVQAKVSAGKFKFVRSIEITAITGSPAATELLTIGRQSVGIYDYFGSNGITALDDQHSVRYHTTQKALFLLTANPIAFVYLCMDAQDARLVYWEGQGRGKKLDAFGNAAPGRGNVMARNWAFAADRIATGIAIQHSFSTQPAIDAFWESWRLAFRNNLIASEMPNNLFQAPFSFKECAFQPIAAESFDFDNGNSSKFMHLVATREVSYFTYAMLMMSYIRNHFDQGLIDLTKRMARAFQDLLWFVDDSVGRGPHTYLPIGYRRAAGAQTPNIRTGALENRIKNALEVPLASDLWTFFTNQADLPAENPLSKAVLNPASYPPLDDDVYVAALAGNLLVNGTPLTLLRNDVNAAQQPTPILLTVGCTADTGAKRRTFAVTGTDPWGVPIDDDCLGAERAGDTLVNGSVVTVLANAWPVAGPVCVTVVGGTTFTSSKRITVRFIGTSSTGGAIQQDVQCIGNGGPRQAFRSTTYFKTVTGIAVFGIQGTLVSTEKFRFGTLQNYLVVNWKEAFTRTFTLWQNFKTVTEVVALTNPMATEHGSPNLGTAVATDSFKVGNPKVGLQQTGGIFPPDAFQSAYAIAVWKFLAASQADELCKRYTGVDASQSGADTLIAAKNQLLDYSEYGTGSAAPAGQHAPGGANCTQWAPLLWALRDVS